MNKSSSFSVPRFVSVAALAIVEVPCVSGMKAVKLSPALLLGLASAEENKSSHHQRKSRSWFSSSILSSVLLFFVVVRLLSSDGVWAYDLAGPT